MNGFARENISRLQPLRVQPAHPLGVSFIGEPATEGWKSVR